MTAPLPKFDAIKDLRADDHPFAGELALAAALLSILIPVGLSSASSEAKGMPPRPNRVKKPPFTAARKVRILNKPRLSSGNSVSMARMP